MAFGGRQADEASPSGQGPAFYGGGVGHDKILVADPKRLLGVPGSEIREDLPVDVIVHRGARGAPHEGSRSIGRKYRGRPPRIFREGEAQDPERAGFAGGGEPVGLDLRLIVRREGREHGDDSRRGPEQGDVGAGTGKHQVRKGGGIEAAERIRAVIVHPERVIEKVAAAL